MVGIWYNLRSPIVPLWTYLVGSWQAISTDDAGLGSRVPQHSEYVMAHFLVSRSWRHCFACAGVGWRRTPRCSAPMFYTPSVMSTEVVRCCRRSFFLSVFARLARLASRSTTMSLWTFRHCPEAHQSTADTASPSDSGTKISTHEFYFFMTSYKVLRNFVLQPRILPNRINLASE